MSRKLNPTVSSKALENERDKLYALLIKATRIGAEMDKNDKQKWNGDTAPLYEEVGQLLKKGEELVKQVSEPMDAIIQYGMVRIELQSKLDSLVKEMNRPLLKDGECAAFFSYNITENRASALCRNCHNSQYLHRKMAFTHKETLKGGVYNLTIGPFIVDDLKCSKCGMIMIVQMD